MRLLPVRLAVGTMALLALASCSSDDTTSAGDPVPTLTTASSLDPSVQASPTVPPVTVAPPPTESATQAPTEAPTAASPAPAGDSAALTSVQEDVELIAPQLESYYRDREYPVDVDQVRQTVEGAGVQLQPGNSIGGYVYDGDAVEFVLCIENTSGAWATYDTAPMTLQRSGETGGCP